MTSLHALSSSSSNLRHSVVHSGKVFHRDLSKIPEDVLDNLRKAFNSLDDDNSGKIRIEEIQEYLEDNGNPLTREEIIDNFFDHDYDGDYELDFEEFASRMAPIQEIIIDPVIDAFNNFAGKLKHIDAIQLKRILINLGDHKFTEDEVNTVFKAIGIKMSDIIEYEPFVKDWRERANLLLD